MAALVVILFILIVVRITEVFIYPGAVIIPTELFFGIAIAELALLWFYAVKEKERIARLRRKAAELNEMKTKFTLAASHELMTPVTVIKGYLKLMRDKTLGELSRGQAEAVETMEKYINRLEGIKDNLTKLAAGLKKSLIGGLQTVSIGALARVTCREVGPFIEKRDQSLNMDIEGGLPGLKIDVNGIQEVILGLLLNAIRFTRNGGAITLRARKDGRSVRVEVEDNGIGIPAEKLQSVFESFYELKDIKKHSSGSIEFNSSGMGVGLSIARDIVEAHGGRIWAESEEGKYARFIFTLPAAAAG